MEAYTSSSGTHAPSVRKDRQQLFEEFMQAGEDWAASSVVVNSRSSHNEKQRGIYKMFSREEPYPQPGCC
jgi:hypothetical protein